MNLQKEYLETVKKYIDNGEIESIRLSTRPDCINIEILEQLKKYGVKTIELGIQSLDPKVLEATDRRYDEGVVENACKLIKKYNFELGVQIMVGLPCSNLESDYATAKKCLELKPDIARIYPTLVISGTELQRMYLKAEYIPISMEEAIQRTKKIYCLLELNRVKIIRVGLQPSEDLTTDGVILAGPFHSAFRDLVENEIYYDFLKNIYENDKRLDIEANEKLVSKIVGQKAKNKKEFYPNFKIKINNSLELYKIKVNEIEYRRDEILLKEI